MQPQAREDVSFLLFGGGAVPPGRREPSGPSCRSVSCLGQELLALHKVQETVEICGFRPFHAVERGQDFQYPRAQVLLVEPVLPPRHIDAFFGQLFQHLP